MNDQHITYKLYLKIISELILHDFTFIIIIYLFYFNDIKRADKLAFIHEYLILNLLLKKYFILLN